MFNKDIFNTEKEYMCDKMAPIPIDKNNIGKKMSMIQFIQEIMAGTLIDYDGFCEFLITTGEFQNYILSKVRYSIEEDIIYINMESSGLSILNLYNYFQIRFNVNLEVVWYNR